MVAEHISRNNSEILGWLHAKQQKGEKVPRNVEEPAHNIARVLKTLTDIAFIMPYAEGFSPDTIDELEKELARMEGES
jgi:hypothetical protein